VYNTIESDYDDNSTTALEVLKKKRGDCTESALLFSALARAVDLPTRTISGLMYDKAMETTTKKPSLCMHEWDEIHDGKRWVSVDPAWGQVYVDAMHIKMGNDDKGYGWLSSVGLMEAKVVSVETK
jgi:transglutaminase-like putative cysteine protease